MTDHSILPPSSAHIWSKCSGWATMSSLYPEQGESESAREGTAAHEVAQRMLDNFTRQAQLVCPDEGEESSNGVIFTDEMIEAAAIYARDVRAVMVASGVFGGPYLGIEKRLEMPSISPVAFGTCDCFIFDHKNLTLYVWDFKFGHDNVDPFNNPQLSCYVSGIVNFLKRHTPLLQGTELRVIFRIAQPRSYSGSGPIKQWDTTLKQVEKYIEDSLIVPAHISVYEAQAQTCVTGTHCKHCSARFACPAALNAGSALYEASTGVTPLLMPDQALGVQLLIVRRAVAHLTSIKDALTEQVSSRLNSGARVQGFTMQSKIGPVKWDVDVEQVELLGGMMGIDLTKKSVVTPRQAVKLGIDESIINGYCSRKSSSLELSEDDGTQALKIFGAL